MIYTLEFEIPGLPKMENQLLRGNSYRARYGHQKLWKAQVFYQVKHRLPFKPLERAKVTLIRCSSRCPDYGGLVSAFKPILDGLVEAGVLIDDTMQVIGIPDYRHEKSAKGQGKIKIKIESINEGETNGR